MDTTKNHAKVASEFVFVLWFDHAFEKNLHVGKVKETGKKSYKYMNLIKIHFSLIVCCTLTSPLST